MIDQPRSPVSLGEPLRLPTLAVLVACCLSASLSAQGEKVRVEAPSTAPAGSTIDVRWTVPETDRDTARDFLSVDPEGAPESNYGKYIYVRTETSGELAVPDEPGSYSVRYHASGGGYPVLGETPIEVTEVEATIEAPSTADAGKPLEVRWKGPDYARDYISVDPKGAPDRTYGRYVYTNQGSPLSLPMPDEPGEYEIRYHMGSSYRVIGSAPVTVLGQSATLEAPSAVDAGSPVTISWTADPGPRDYISIDPKGSAEKTYGDYAYTNAGNPLEIRAPDEPGSYEIRYHMGATDKVLASSPLEVRATTATVGGPDSVAGGSEFEVAWTGPANKGDFVTIVPAGASDRDYLSYAYAAAGSPATIEAPLEPGSHELRYVTGRARRVLARAPIDVTPGEIPGTIRVVAAADGPDADGSPGTIEVILDASGSMLQRLDGERRIEIAKAALVELVEQTIPAQTRFALRVFGHQEAGSCRTDLELPIAPLDRSRVVSTIRGLQAMNLAKTPIAASLRAAAGDLAGSTGPVTIVLVTDGEETCDGDPEAAIRELQNAGFDVRVNIVGFAIDDLELEETFQEWARLGNGRYVAANDEEQLEAAMSGSVRLSFEVVRDGAVLATGVVGGEPVSVPSGTYSVRVLGSGVDDLGPIELEPRGEVVLTVP